VWPIVSFKSANSTTASWEWKNCTVAAPIPRAPPMLVVIGYTGDKHDFSSEISKEILIVWNGSHLWKLREDKKFKYLRGRRNAGRNSPRHLIFISSRTKSTKFSNRIIPWVFRWIIQELIGLRLNPEGSIRDVYYILYSRVNRIDHGHYRVVAQIVPEMLFEWDLIRYFEGNVPGNTVNAAISAA
jgi:hypothetical protein